jgi:mono/diheme cytochrome c family protein
MGFSRRAALSAAIVMVCGGWSVVALAGDVETGHQLARQWCAGCHLIGPDEKTSSTDTAPPFAEIAKDQAETEERLKGWLSQSHPAMPDLMLSREQNDDLVSYLLSLRGG